MKMIEHDLGLLPDRVLLPFHVGTKLFGCALRVELRVILDGLDELVIGVDRNVVRENIKDELLLDRLPHRVAVERAVLDDAVNRVGVTEGFERLVLGRGGKREI